MVVTRPRSPVREIYLGTAVQLVPIGVRATAYLTGQIGANIRTPGEFPTLQLFDHRYRVTDIRLQ